MSNALYHSFTVITCPALAHPDNGNVNQLGNTPGGLAIYSCNNNFELSGEMSRRCGLDGQWEGEAPLCEGEEVMACPHVVIISIPLIETISCPVLEHPDRGLVTIGGNSPGSVATYSCNGGHSLIGSDTRQCQSDGTWSNESPLCVRGMFSPISMWQ